MRTVTFQSVLHGVAALIWGTADDLQSSDAVTLTRFINKEVRTAVEEYPWPELCPVEQRYFRAAWTATSYASGAEVYHTATDQYWRSNAATLAGDVPGASSKWDDASADLDAYISLAQSGQTLIGECLAVWDKNPRRYKNAEELAFWLSEHGIQVSPGTPTSVWVEFRRRPPEFTATVWASGSFAVGALVYYTVTGECYECIATATSEVPTDTAKWRKIDFPYVVASYVTQAAYADWLKTDGQHSKATGERGEAELLLARAMQQNPITQRQNARYSVVS